ncbi:MAG: hypothetical protein M1472_01965 [Planctomycetes bacterium]|jgi:hypothetical protein|nr:hypothetical protein [Planctomycetota bacterium]
MNKTQDLYDKPARELAACKVVTRAGGVIPPEMNNESTNHFTTADNVHKTTAIPVLLSAA